MCVGRIRGVCVCVCVCVGRIRGTCVYVCT